MVSRRNYNILILLVLAAATVARVCVFTPFGVHHPDEAFQYLEQAHRLAFGNGIVPWEYRFGMRSWLLPLTLAGPMWLGDAIAPGTMLYMILPRALVALFAATAMWSAWTIGARISRWHAFAAFAVTALWFESVFFSVHVLTESIAATCVLAAVAMLSARRTPGRYAMFGMLLALSVVMRFHYLPALGILALLTLRTDWRGWGWSAAGGLVVAIVSGGVDIAMGLAPFGWVAENFHQNLVLDKASEFGVMPVWAYLAMWLADWGGMLPVIVVLAAFGGRRFPALLAVALVNLLVHSLIGHKEYRFIWLSTQLLILLAGVGTVDAVEFVHEKLGFSRARLALGAVAIWLTGSIALAVNQPMLVVYGEDSFRLARRLSSDQACGIMLTGAYDYWIGGGEAFTHGGDATKYFVNDLSDLPAMTRAIDRLSLAADGILAPRGLYPLPTGYREVACGTYRKKPFCAYRRPGGCSSVSGGDRFLLQNVMTRYDR